MKFTIRITALELNWANAEKLRCEKWLSKGEPCKSFSNRTCRPTAGGQITDSDGRGFEV